MSVKRMLGLELVEQRTGNEAGDRRPREPRGMPAPAFGWPRGGCGRGLERRRLVASCQRKAACNLVAQDPQELLTNHIM